MKDGYNYFNSIASVKRMPSARNQNVTRARFIRSFRITLVTTKLARARLPMRLAFQVNLVLKYPGEQSSSAPYTGYTGIYGSSL
eukprot:1392146-Amorphochlora_amoeboformis.AAC.1